MIRDTSRRSSMMSVRDAALRSMISMACVARVSANCFEASGLFRFFGHGLRPKHREHQTLVDLAHLGHELLTLGCRVHRFLLSADRLLPRQHRLFARGDGDL